MQPASRTSHVVCASITVLVVCFSPMTVVSQPEKASSAAQRDLFRSERMTHIA